MLCNKPKRPPIVEENADGQNILIGKTRPKPYHQELDHTDLGTFSPLALVKKNRTGLGLKGKDLEDFKRAQKDNKHWYDYYEILDDKVVHITYFVAEVPKSGHTLEETEIVADFILEFSGSCLCNLILRDFILGNLMCLLSKILITPLTLEVV